MSFPTAMICSTIYIPVSRKDVLVCIVQHISTLNFKNVRKLFTSHINITYFINKVTSNPTANTSPHAFRESHKHLQNNAAQTTLWFHHNIHTFTFRRNGKADTSYTRQTKKVDNVLPVYAMGRSGSMAPLILILRTSWIEWSAPYSA